MICALVSQSGLSSFQMVVFVCLSVGCLKPDDRVRVCTLFELSLAGDRDVLFVCCF